MKSITSYSHAVQGEMSKIILDANTPTDKAAHHAYQAVELARAREILATLGYYLDDTQVHLGGERYVMSGRKLVLVGTRVIDNTPVVIKFSSEASGRAEITHEHFVATSLSQLNFASHTFAAPSEYEFIDDVDHTLRIVAFIAEDQPLTSLPIKDQFFLALKAFKVQAGLHATTYGHLKDVRNIFGLSTADDYVALAEYYLEFITANAPKGHDLPAVASACSQLKSEVQTIRMYTGFVTHTDFAPHNVRCHDNELYLLDQTSLHFGNKYESWARFINYMTLYNPELAQYLITYVKDNKVTEEYRSLRLMQIYKLVYLLAFYVSSYQKADGDHQTLSAARLEFWHQALTAALADTTVDPTLIAAYKTTRDSLRGEAEKSRQRALGQL